jgi:hypothetical protein
MVWQRYTMLGQKKPQSPCIASRKIGSACGHRPAARNRPLRRLLVHSLGQVSWLPGYLHARLPMRDPHSGLVSVRAWYSCGNSSLAAFPLSKEGLSRLKRTVPNTIAGCSWLSIANRRSGAHWDKQYHCLAGVCTPSIRLLPHVLKAWCSRRRRARIVR